MAKPRPFAQALVRARREQGFRSGHAFYRARDGRRTLGMLYANYMALERGTSLPKPWRLEAILKALNLSEPSLARRELVYAYLTSLLGSDALLKDLEPSPIQSALSSEEVARAALRHRAAHLDLEQWRALASDPAAYYCHIFLINTPGWQALADVAAAVRAPLAKVKAAVKALAAAKIVETSGGKARSLLNYKILQPLPLLPETTSLKAAILDKREAFARDRGSLVHHATLTSRIGKLHLKRYFERLSETVRMFGVYGDVEKSDDTDVYYVDAKIFKIFD